MTGAADGRGGPGGSPRSRIPHAPAVAGVLLALAAMTEAIARGAGTGMSVAGLVGDVRARR